jgi:deazaflavin-dependent oxidoreductase (nitroreductase family)
MNFKQLTKSSPRGLLRFALRLPIFLYKVHLGWVLGDRFLILRHVGRKSKQWRQVVLEVVKHDLLTGTYTIASGWGEKSDWFLNVLAHPEVEIIVGTRHFKAVAGQLTSLQAEAVLHEYAEQHPFAFHELAGLLVESQTHDPGVLIELMANKIPLLELICKKENK